jgi:uncharacterized protein (TIGR02597 family)
MRKNIFYTLITLTFAASFDRADASSATVATVPDGMMTFAIAHGTVTNMSLPLTKVASYTGVVSQVTTNTITVEDSPGPFTSNLATPSSPYFIKMLTGNEAGRVMLIDGNTSSVLTADTTDHATGAAVALTATGCAIQAGDVFEIFAGDTLASIFGTGGSGLVLTGAANISSSDNVQLYTTVGAAPTPYYFNTTAGYWERSGSTLNANNTVLYPYAAFAVSRRANHPDTTLVVGGRVTSVEARTKVSAKSGVYTSSHFATDVKLSQLHLTNWTTGVTPAAADELTVWDANTGKFDVFYQKPDSTWRKSTDATTDVSNFTVAAGTVTAMTKHSMVEGATAFVPCSLPYSL